jgi:hypothetical protein
MFDALRRAVYHTILDVAGSKITLASVEKVTQWQAYYQSWRAERSAPKTPPQDGQ